MRKGFTLVELMIVISIMSVLIAVVLPNLSDARKQARDRKRIIDIRAIQQGMQLYKNSQPDVDEPYPAALPQPGTSWSSNIGGNTVTYIASFPKDPLCSTDPCGDYQYYYVYDSIADKYVLSACLETPRNATDPGQTPSTFKDQFATCQYWFTISGE